MFKVVSQESAHTFTMLEPSTGKRFSVTVPKSGDWIFPTGAGLTQPPVYRAVAVWLGKRAALGFLQEKALLAEFMIEDATGEAIALIPAFDNDRQGLDVAAYTHDSQHIGYPKNAVKGSLRAPRNDKENIAILSLVCEVRNVYSGESDIIAKIPTLDYRAYKKGAGKKWHGLEGWQVFCEKLPNYKGAVSELIKRAGGVYDFDLSKFGKIVARREVVQTRLFELIALYLTSAMIKKGNNYVI